MTQLIYQMRIMRLQMDGGMNYASELWYFGVLLMRVIKKIHWREGAVSSSIMKRPPLGRKHQLVSRAHPSTRQDHSSKDARTQHLRSQGQMHRCTALQFQRTLRCVFLAVLPWDRWNFHWSHLGWGDAAGALVTVFSRSSRGHLKDAQDAAAASCEPG